MQAAAVATTVQDLAHSTPSREAARKLSALREEPEQLREAWAETVERHGDKPTAAQTREVVAQRRPKPTPAPLVQSSPPPERLPVLAMTVRDARGNLERARQIVANMAAAPAPDDEDVCRAALSELDAVEVEMAALHADVRRLLAAGGER